MNTLETLVLVFGCVHALILVVLLVTFVTRAIWHSQAAKKDRAVRLLCSLLTEEYLTRARLVSSQYLLADPRDPKYARFAGKNLEELDVLLRSSSDAEERDARVLIRAVPDFFHAVDLARRQGYIRRRELLFSQVYAWYWVNILEERTVGMSDRSGAFAEFKWMRTETDIDSARRERGERQRRLGISTGTPC